MDIEACPCSVWPPGGAVDPGMESPRQAPFIAGFSLFQKYFLSLQMCSFKWSIKFYNHYLKNRKIIVICASRARIFLSVQTFSASQMSAFVPCRPFSVLPASPVPRLSHRYLDCWQDSSGIFSYCLSLKYTSWFSYSNSVPCTLNGHNLFYTPSQREICVGQGDACHALQIFWGHLCSAPRGLIISSRKVFLERHQEEPLFPI